MLKEYLTSIANAMRSKLGSTSKINAQNFVDKIGEVYDIGFLEGLAKSKGKKTQYIEEYFTGSKQYLTYSIDFEPKLIVFQSSDGPNIYDANKPDIEIEQLNVLKMFFNCELGFAEGQNYKTRGATAYVYKHSDNTQKYATSTGVYANYAFNPTTQKWDITLGRADTSTAATRFVSGGQYANQILIVGEAEKEEPSVLRGNITLTEKSKILTIEGLPKAPKEFNLLCLSPKIPTVASDYHLNAIDYFAEGFTLNNSNTKKVASIQSIVHKDVSSNYYANTTVNESVQIELNMFSFENGIFTIDFSKTSSLYFCENFSCKWTAIF